MARDHLEQKTEVVDVGNLYAEADERRFERLLDCLLAMKADHVIALALG
ncbi:MAG TPA: hypothetical protein VFN55_15765 [Solirubrobacteraceae bacterium]|nr:hypothetical protein [Solirubrobacteraceae bacterium]